MYSFEEVKTLMFLVGAAVLGRVLFYRSMCLEGSFKQRLKIRLLQWLWEIPVVVTVALLAFESVVYFQLRPSAGIVFAIFIGYVGIGTLKIWLEDWMETRVRGRNPGRRKEDDYNSED
jgi:hypothetical protein